MGRQTPEEYTLYLEQQQGTGRIYSSQTGGTGEKMKPKKYVKYAKTKA